VPVYFQLLLLLGQAELTWVAGYILDSLPTHKWSPIQVLTGPCMGY